MDVIHYFHVQEIYVNRVYESFMGGGADDMLGGHKGSASYGGIGEMLEGVDQTMEEDFNPQGNNLSQDDSISAKRGRGAEEIERLLLGQRGDGEQSGADEEDEEDEYGYREDGEEGNDLEDTTSEQSRDF